MWPVAFRYVKWDRPTQCGPYKAQPDPTGDAPDMGSELRTRKKVLAVGGAGDGTGGTGESFAASVLVRCWQLVQMTLSSCLEGLKRRMKINAGPRFLKICEERRESAPRGHCHSNALGGKVPGEDIPRKEK